LIDDEEGVVDPVRLLLQALTKTSNINKQASRGELFLTRTPHSHWYNDTKSHKQMILRLDRGSQEGDDENAQVTITPRHSPLSIEQ
jgi:hypothetical protein